MDNAYDDIGNLIQDTKDSVSSIYWTNAQKIGQVVKTDRKITFRYDPMQNRIAKYSKQNSGNAERRTYYIRDAQGNVMSTYSAWVQNSSGTITWDSVKLAEQHIYGSSRVGMAIPGVKLYPTVPKNPHLSDSSHYAILEGWKRYEITNHLGNVLAVITDRKRGLNSSGQQIQWFEADVLSTQQYYPFGMLMPGRQYALSGYDYRYGFNGKEGDDEVKGDDNQQDYGMRIYDPRVGRFLSVDPSDKKIPDLSPFSFAGNSTLWLKDKNGLEPDRNQAGTIEQATAQWRNNKLTSAEDIKNFIQKNENAVRYVYTEEKGWIDLQHYFGTLTYGKLPMDALEPSSGDPLFQKLFFGPGANESYFSYEDLPSNQFAFDSDNLWEEYLASGKDEFLVKKTRLKSGEDLISAVQENLIAAKATLPTNAPNWEQIPFKDHGERKRLPETHTKEVLGIEFIIPNSDKENAALLQTGNYVPQNHTSKPYDLKDFPAAPSSLEKGDRRKGATGY